MRRRLLVLGLVLVGATYAGPRAGLAQSSVGSVLTGDISGCYLAVFISPSDTQRGDYVGGHFWGRGPNNNFHFTYNLPVGQTSYIHVQIEPPNNDRCFFGYFTLTGGATFANHKTTMDTDPDFWLDSTNGWGIGNKKPVASTNSTVYVRQDPVINTEDPTAPVIMDAAGGPGFQHIVYFTTPIIPGR